MDYDIFRDKVLAIDNTSTEHGINILYALYGPERALKILEDSRSVSNHDSDDSDAWEHTRGGEDEDDT